ncbi:sialoadhesin-like [Labeo rohita]|uniref:sialoadhesin-like n=1 Tax=Labeo rohita TaxID=84645 RepID=UPI0021E28586|nr:sialoadhesin-like [Labeo rohita]
MMETLVTFLLMGSLIQGVFCGFSISLPQTVEALQGSCVFIPCTFDIDQQYEYLLTDSAKRMWFKDGTVKVFNSSSPNTGLLKGEIFGTATQKNCSTRFDNVSQSHNGSYYFRIEANSALKYSYIAPTFSQVQIAVLGSPPKPIVSVFKDLQEVMEGSSVSLRCSTKIFCPFHSPNLTWSSSLNENITERQYQNQTELISDLNFTVSHRHHGVTFTCTATHQLQQQITTQQSHMLRVQYAPKNTSLWINPAGLVVEGRSVTLSCSSDANPAVNYTWYRDTEELLNPVQTGPNLTINTDPTHSGRYYCTAQNKHGTQNTSVLLDVQYAPKNTSVTVNPAGLVVEGRAVTLSCSSDANPAVNYTWYRDTKRLLNPVQTGPDLIINNTNPTHRGRYYCTAENKHGTQNTSVLLDVQYAPKNTSVTVNPAGLVVEGRAVTLSCSSDANPAVNYTWYRDTERLLNPVQTGPNLTIYKTNPTHRGRYYCTAQNKHGTQNTSVLLDVQCVFCGFSISLPQAVEALQGSCVFIPCTFDINQQYEYLLTDSAKRMWFKDGTVKVFNSSSPNTGLLKGEIFGTATQKNCSTRFDNVSQSHNGSYYFRIEGNSALKYSYIAPTFSQVQIAVLGSPPKPIVSVFKDLQEVMEGSSVSLRCSTKIFCPFHSPNLTWSSSLNENITERQYQNQTELISDLNFTVSHRHHGVTFTCTATHQLQQQITTQQSHTLRVQYAPKNTSLWINPAGLVVEGRSVTLSCSSDANPAVNYTWYRDTEGLLNPVQTGPNLTINKTNPTHSGRYYCTAQNKHGTQNTSVLLDVQYAPKNISVSVNPAGLVVEGRSVTLSCSSDANPAVNYTWYRDIERPLNPVQTGPDLTINNIKLTHSGRYYCTAQNKHGTQNTSVLLDVQQTHFCL